jgi:excisionase family DNA binding protein
MRHDLYLPFLDIIEAARLCGLHPGTIRAATRRGELLHVRQRNTRKILITREALEAWIAEHFQGLSLADEGRRNG